MGDVRLRAGWVGEGRSFLRRLGTAVLDGLYPPACLGCEAPLATADALCPRCFTKLYPITPPYCERLGIPFEVPLGPGAVSPEALADPPPFERARAAVAYSDLAQTVVGRLKYGDRPEIARFCARLMAGAGADLWLRQPVIVPVPLHPWRHLQRRYNQSEELARALGRLTGLTVETRLLERTRKTRQQVGLSADARSRNVAGAFAARGEVAARLAGRPVVVVDDVVTTGSTVRAVTHALHRAGLCHVDVISFARVVICNGAPI